MVAGDAGESRVDLPLFLAGLAEKGLSDVLAEGGGTLNRALLAAGLVDRLHLIVFPAVLDGGSVNLFEKGGDLARFRLGGGAGGGFLMVRYGRAG